VCICEEKQIRIIIVNRSSLSSVLCVPLEIQHAAARAGWSAGTISLVFYVIYSRHTADHSPFLLVLQGPGDASASRTKIQLSGLELCAFGPVSHRQKQKKRWEKRREGGKKRRRETAVVGEYRSSSILMCANSPAPAD